MFVNKEISGNLSAVTSITVEIKHRDWVFTGG